MSQNSIATQRMMGPPAPAIHTSAEETCPQFVRVQADPNFEFNYLYIVVGVSVFIFLVEFVAQSRQLKRYFSNEIPAGLKSIKEITQEKYQKSQEHSRDMLGYKMHNQYNEKILETIIQLTWVPAIVWTFTAKLLNKFNFPPECVASNGTKYYSDIWHGLAYILISGLFAELMGYSEELYMNFIIKERHGFNKMTIGVYFSDKIKEYILSAVIGLPVYYGFMWLVIWGGEQFYIYVSIFVAVTIILMVNIVPNVIMPLFNTYTDLPEGKLKDEIVKLAQRIGFPLSKIYIVDASKRSAHSNAYYYGFGSNKRIVLFDTLLQQHKEEDGGIDEIVGIVRHELGHWKYMHPFMSLTYTLVDLFALFGLFSLVINNHTLLAQFGFQHESNFVSFLIFLQCYEGFSWISNFFKTAITRKMEFAADAFAAEDPLYQDALCRALIKIHLTNAANLNPDPFYASLNFSHPQLTERLKAMKFKGFEEQEEEMNPTKELGNIDSCNDLQGPKYNELIEEH